MIPGLAFGLSAPAILLGVGAVTVVGVVARSGIVQIPRGEVAVTTVAGGANRVLTPGRHLTAPLVSQVHRYDARTQRLEQARIETRTADGTPVVADIVVEFAIADVETVFQSVEDHEAIAIRQTESSVLDTLATADDGTVAMSERRLALDIRDALQESLGEIGLQVESVHLSAQTTGGNQDTTDTSNHNV